MKSVLLLLGLLCTSTVVFAEETQFVTENTGSVTNILNLEKSVFSKTPVFECDSWPFEGVPFFRVKTDTVTLYEKPSLFSSVSKPIRIEKGSVVSFQFGVSELIRHQKQGTPGLVEGMTINTKVILDKSIQFTMTPGIIKASKNGSFVADSSYGKIKSCSAINDSKTISNKEFRFKKGDTIENLLYMGEGECLYRFKKEVFVHHGCLFEVQGLQKDSEPETEWWVSFKTENKHAGWFRITESNNVLELIDTVK